MSNICMEARLWLLSEMEERLSGCECRIYLEKFIATPSGYVFTFRCEIGWRNEWVDVTFRYSVHQFQSKFILREEM